MKSLLHRLEIIPVRLVEKIKQAFKVKTFVVENAFVLIILVVTNLLTADWHNPWKWIQVLAVYLTFEHAGISQRLEEMQRKKVQELQTVEVECYNKLWKVFVGKELLWMATFIYLQAWPALVGVFIFLMFYPWRKLWRKYHKL